MLLGNQNMKRNNSLKRAKTLLKKTILPTGSLSFLDRVDNLEKIYRDIIAIEYPNVPRESLASLESFWTVIKYCYNLHQEGLSAEATLFFYEKIFCNEDYIDKYELEPQSRLYRIRKTEVSGLFSKEEMFHIPFDKRHLITNGRYSINGIPSLYLCESTYICWEELGNPNFDTCNVSMFVNEQMVSVINVAPIMKAFDKDKILKYPLAYVCSLGTNHPEGPFKEEYVIPQMLMQCLLIHNKRNTKTSYVGIRYLSNKAYVQRPLFPLNEKKDLKRYFNYAFPAYGPYDNDGMSKKLKSIFSWSSPDTYGRYRLRTANMSVEERPTTDTYSVSAFSQIENWCNVQWAHDNMLSYNSWEGALSL